MDARLPDLGVKGRPHHLFITGGYPPERGIFAHRALLHLKPHVDTRVLKLCALRPDRLRTVRYELDGIPVTRLGGIFLPGLNSNRHMLPLAAWSTARRVRSLLEWADLVEVNSVYPVGAVVVAWLESLKLAGKPLVAGVTGDDAMIYLPRLFEEDKGYVVRILKPFDAFLCNSAVMARRMERFVPHGPPALTALRGVDFDLFNPSVTPQGPMSTVRGFRFVFVGGFQSWSRHKMEGLNVKGGHVLLAAWQAVERELENVHLGIAGPGSEAPQLEGWRRSLHDPSRVHIVPGGVLRPDEMPGVIRAADCLVIPSLSEGLPNVANEAQACGVPVLGTDAGGIPESVIHGVSGWIIPSRSAEALADGLRWCASHQDELRVMGRRGEERMREQFTWEGFVRVALQAYGLALGRAQQGTGVA